jgi:ABC-type polysaccharide/polyol phosphate export permease
MTPSATRAWPGSFFLRNLYQRRNLLGQMVLRDFRQRFVGSAAGWLWGVIHPAVLLLSWTFVFQVCLKVPPPPNALTQNYTIFLLCGMLPWLLFQETVQRAANSLLEHSNLITKTVFPSEIVPVSVFLSSLIHHAIAVVLVSVAIAVWDEGLTPMMWLLPVYVLLTGLFAIGLGWILAALNVYVRDTAQITQVALTLWFWVTPIFITRELVPQRLRFLMDWNPMAYVVNSYRHALLSLDWPSFREMGLLAAFAIGTFAAGGLVFRHLKRGFADVL